MHACSRPGIRSTAILHNTKLPHCYFFATYETFEGAIFGTIDYTGSFLTRFVIFFYLSCYLSVLFFILYG